jgi:HK97 family phage prohead protease
MEREIRVSADTWPEADLDIRATGNGMTFNGYAAVFNSPSEPMPFIERIRPGAFAKSLGEKRNIKMFLNHNSDVLLGATRSGTLRLSEDDRGLRVDADLPDTSAGRDTAALLKRGDIDSISFGFQVVKDEWSEKQQHREIVEARLFEVSAVTGWPAYAATSATVRELAAEVGVEPDVLADAFKVLQDAEARLTKEQHELLIATINTRYDLPVAPPVLAEWRAKWAALPSL